MRAPRVTVCIPTFNRSGLLREAVQSVLAQTFTDFRLVIADNASTDDTRDMAARLEDPRVLYVRRKTNVGSQENFNMLLESVDTDFVLILPDDDPLYPSHLALTARALDEHPTAGIVATGFDVIDFDGRLVFSDMHRLEPKRDFELEARGAFRRRAMGDHWPIHWSTALMRTEAANAAGPFRESDYPADDLGLFLRLSRSWDIVHVRDVLGALRMHTATVTAQHTAFTGRGYELPDEFHELVREIRLRSIAELDLPPQEARTLVRDACAAYDRALVENVAIRASRDSKPFVGLRDLSRLVKRNPRLALVPRSWRLVLAELGGRRARRLSSRLRNRASQPSSWL